jgi:hypothetical protein
MKQFILLSLISIFCFSVKAEKKEKTFDKSFAAESIKQVFVENRYGKIEVEQWDKSQIQFNILVKVESKKAETSAEMLDQIDVEFVEKINYLSVSTQFDENFNFKKITNKLFSGGYVRIDYKVMVPKGMTLKMVNRDGNIYLGDYTGVLNIDIKNGDVKLESANKSCEINVEGGRFDAVSLEDAKCILKSCTADIKNCEFVNIDCKDSHLKIEKGNELNITSTRGECRLGQIEVLRGSSSLTKYEISDIGDELVFELWLGSMNVRNIHNMFSLVDLKTTRAKTGLTFMEGAAYDIEIRHTKSVKLDLPAGMNLTKRNAAEKRTYISEGKVGGKSKFGSKVKINTIACKLFIQ